MAEATIQLTCTVEAGPAFKVSAAITVATDISTAVFVHQVGAVEIQDTYIRVATLNDMEAVGEVRGDVGNLYRKSSAEAESSSILAANGAKQVFKNSVSRLVEQTTDAAANFVGVFTFDLPLEGE